MKHHELTYQEKINDYANDGITSINELPNDKQIDLIISYCIETCTDYVDFDFKPHHLIGLSPLNRHKSNRYVYELLVGDLYNRYHWDIDNDFEEANKKIEFESCEQTPDCFSPDNYADIRGI